MRKEQTARLLAAQQRVAALGVLHSEALAVRLGLTATDVKCIALLLQGPRAPRELAIELRLTRSAVTTVIDRLVAAGYARREQSAEDRRSVNVQMVAARADEAVELYRPLHGRMSELLERYDDIQLAILLDFAERATNILSEEIRRIQTG
jgi:DNA-binding MarR family transcriptional regulator